MKAKAKREAMEISKGGEHGYFLADRSRGGGGGSGGGGIEREGEVGHAGGALAARRPPAARRGRGVSYILFIYLSKYYLSIYLSIYLFIYLSTYLFI